MTNSFRRGGTHRELSSWIRILKFHSLQKNFHSRIGIWIHLADGVEECRTYSWGERRVLGALRHRTLQFYPRILETA